MLRRRQRPSENGIADEASDCAAWSRERASAGHGNQSAAQCMLADSPVEHDSWLPAGKQAEDASLDGMRAVYNAPEVPMAERLQAILDYRNRQMARLSPPQLLAMQNGAEGKFRTQTVYRNLRADPPVAGLDRGVHGPLYEKLAGDESMQAILKGLVLEDRVDIIETFEAAQALAREQNETDVNTSDTNLMALQAMATLANHYKFIHEHPVDSHGLSQDLWMDIVHSSSQANQQSGTNSMVMGHGVQHFPANRDPNAGELFEGDRNNHFFTHAYLTASLVHEDGWDAEHARAASAVLGAQYELYDGSASEHSGNSALKDVLVNAEGAHFGTSLMSEPDTLLPGMYDGPEPEIRTIPRVGRVDSKLDFDPESRAILDVAQDTSKLTMLQQMASGYDLENP